MVQILIVFCLISYLSHFLLGSYFWGFLVFIFLIVQICALCLIVFHYFIILLFHYHPRALGNMATFPTIQHLDLTIMVNNLETTFVFEQCLCVMFFSQFFLHISKDVSYDSNNLVLSLLYQILMTSSQGR